MRELARSHSPTLFRKLAALFHICKLSCKIEHGDASVFLLEVCIRWKVQLDTI